MEFTKKPYLQLPATDAMTVMWETDAPGSTLLRVWDCFAPGIPKSYECEYRPTGPVREFSGAAGTCHKAAASGLLPGTDYCYQAVSAGEDGEELCSDILVFRTAPQAGVPFRVLFTAETGGADQPENIPDIAREAALCRPDLLLFMGDAVWDGSREEDWDKFFFRPLGDIFKSTPFYHIMGNHDCLGRDKTARLFTAPPTYSFVYSNARFIILDSTLFARRDGNRDDYTEMKPFDSFNEDDPQWKFLEDELARQDTKWTFVCFHYPPYASALFEAPCMRRLCPLFDKYKVDAVFSSHTIHYERSHPLRGGVAAADGTVYFIVGGVGDYARWVRHKTLPVTARIMPKPHFVTMEVTDFGISVKAFDRNGALFDIWEKTK